MYDRFTDRARKVMQLANQEAQRSNYQYLGTSHILLALVKEGYGVAANALKNLDIDLREIRLEMENVIQPEYGVVTMENLPQSPRAKQVIEYSIEEARNLNHNYVGTEHLLLGLLREQESSAAQVLKNLGLNLGDVREEVLTILGVEPKATHSSGATKTPKSDCTTVAITATCTKEEVFEAIGAWVNKARPGELATYDAERLEALAKVIRQAIADEKKEQRCTD